MKVLVLFLAVFPYFCFAQLKYSVYGDIKELKSYHTVYLISDNNKNSAIVEDGKFTFIGSIDKPKLVTLGIFDTTNNKSSVPPVLLSFRQFYLSASEIIISGETLNSALIDADKLNSIYSKYWFESDSLRTLAVQRNRVYLDKMMIGILTDDEAIKHQEQLQDFIKKHQVFDLNFLENNDFSEFSVDLIDRYLNQYNVLELKKFYERIPVNFIDTNQDSRVKSKINRFEKLSVGAVAPNFTMLDTSRKEVFLEQLRGKVILLEFWASWCIPCRQENLFYLDIYNKYKDKNFEIVAISFNKENEKSEWLRAIQTDKTQNWIHLSDLKGYQSPLFKLYEIGGLPNSYLLDEKGIIIGHNLKGKDLEDKLKILLK
ncbi:redoxin domain-containing protein [Sphingobacterium sp. HJSM2_6]|uniref:redoxin domain-containing protein n=1 Tax=Sphingobacterium sp. HJSM2_6 TaxID=3366264 RepID=UPI003BC4D814